MKRSVLMAGMAGAGLLFGLCLSLEALINVNFTPVHLVQESKLILELHFDSVKGGKAVASVKQALKGKTDVKTVTVDLTTTAYKAKSAFVEKMIQVLDGPALLFVGQFGGGELEPAGAEEAEQRAFLHFGTTWLTLVGGKAGTWDMDGINEHMAGTWAGSTDMLLRAVNYILKDPAADVPVSTGATWAEEKKFGDFQGKVSAARPVDLAGDGKVVLFVACEKGDKLFAWDAKVGNLADVTGKHKLRSSSLAFAWGDFSGNGRLDLMSWDGKSLSCHRQAPDGTFEAAPWVTILGYFKDTSPLALASLDVGIPGRAGLLVSTKGWPVLCTTGADGTVTTKGLAEGAFTGKDLGNAGPCLVADFDGDGIPDVIQLFAKGSLFYKGAKPGTFAAPVACPIELGAGRSNAWLGDYDADGLLDVFCVSEDALRLWHNLGKGQFAETLAGSGEIVYIGQPGGVDGMTGDFNNDGRQDVLIVYSSGAPQLFFNRGFRSFGKALTLLVGGQDLLPEAGKGAQTGCLADLNGDGAQDMALVLNNGEGWILVRDLAGAGGLCLRAQLPLNGPYAGPLTVTGWNDVRCLGAWNVVAGDAGAFFGETEAGPCTLSWQFPGGKANKKQVLLETKPVRLVLEP